jgi:phage gp46-like protein
MIDFQGDLLLYSTDDGGEIDLDENNIFSNDTGFETAIYLSLFCGNEQDNGSESTKNLEYWGNKLETNEPNNKLTSRLQNIIKGYPATPGNINKVKSAVNNDLAWMISDGIIDSLEITATIPTRNRLNLEINGLKNKSKIFGTAYEMSWLSKL